MENSIFDIVKQIYSAASTPVAVADEKYNIVWKNSAAEACEIFKSASVRFVCESKPVEGVTTVLFDGVRHTFNVITMNSNCYIVEYIGRAPSHDISHMKNYFSFLCTRLRESAAQISMAANDIDLFIKANDTNVASSLNRIDKNVLLLLREALIPEILFYAADPFCKNETINLAHRIELAAADAERVLGRLTDIWQNAVDDVCANINYSVFDVIIAYMTAEACGGELYPDRVEYVVERDEEQESRGYVSVRSICLSNKKNNPFKLEFLKQDEFFTEAAFRELLAEKYGISFEKKYHSDGIECVMFLNVLPANKQIIKTGIEPTIIDERFSSMAVALSEKHYGEHYKNIKMK